MRREGVKWLAVVFCLVFWAGTALGSPGSKRWDYPAAGGTAWNKVLVNSQGDRLMVTTVVSSSQYSWSVVCVDEDGNFKWQKSYSGPAQYAVFEGAAAIDSHDNLVVAGMVKKSDGSFPWHIVSYDSETGAVNWEKEIDVGFSSSPSLYGLVFVNDMAVDSHDNLIVVGLCLHSSKALGYVISLDSNGNKNWEATVGTESVSYSFRVVVDSHDNAIVGSLVADSSGKGSWDVTSFSPSGGKNWEKTFGVSSSTALYALAVDPNGRVVVVGYNDGKWKVVCLDSDGTQVWEDVKGDGIADDVVIDSQGNAVVVGELASSAGVSDFAVVSYSPSGGVNWQSTYDDPDHKGDRAYAVAVDAHDNVVAVGYTGSASTGNDWRVACYASDGTERWTASYDSGVSKNDEARNVAWGPKTGDFVVSGSTFSGEYSRLIDYEGYGPAAPPAPSGHVLVPSEVRTVDPAPAAPDIANGKYLGFGDVASGGHHFKVEAQFPAYLKQSDNSVMSVKIFVAAQLPDDYSRLAFFDSSNNLLYQPPGQLSSWKGNVSGAVAKTTIMPEVDTSSSFSSIPSGTHYWYTLVVPDTVPDDFAGVDWSTTPWEITVNILNVP